jgi:hypothetical protein
LPSTIISQLSTALEAGNQPLAWIRSVHNHNPDRNPNLLPFRPVPAPFSLSDTMRHNPTFSDALAGNQPLALNYPPGSTRVSRVRFGVPPNHAFPFPTINYQLSTLNFSGSGPKRTVNPDRNVGVSSPTVLKL